MKSSHIIASAAAAVSIAACTPAKYVALSFDDGPNTVTTPAVLDVLEEFNVLASFFVIGNNIDEESAEMMKRAVSLGCDIENHSLTHSPMSSLSIDSVKTEIAVTSRKIQEVTGSAPAFFRPPYIDHNPAMHEAIDLTFICGVGCEDWIPENTADMRAQRIIETVIDGDIILLHDMLGNDATVEALKIIIPALKEQGYEFVTVPELFKLKKVTPRRGVIYTNVLQQEPFQNR